MEKKQEKLNKYGLFGKDIGYSFSRGYFKSKFKKEGIAATYENFDVPNASGLQEYLNDTFVKGYNVTIPYKEAIIPFLDRLDEHALKIGAVNTIKREADGTLTGMNTDFVGFRDTLLEHFKDSLFLGYGTQDYEPRGHKAIILGTGGASKGVQYALEQLGVECQFISRKRTEKNLTYDDLDKTIIDAQTFIVNTTPLGTFPDVDASPDVPYDFIDVSHVAFDLIYNPTETQFLKLAAAKGATIINGFRMLELQAEASWTIWNE